MSAAELRRRLAEIAPQLRPVADEVLAESSRIDVVAIDADGSAVAAFDAEGDDLRSFTRALAGVAWLEAHLPDWRQIAPNLGIDPLAPVTALLVASSFAPETRAAARLVGAARVELRELEPRETATPARPVSGTPPRRPSQPFRTGLSDADLGIRDGAAG
jgi:hypothetical protein